VHDGRPMRRTDPERRERIVAVCLDVIAERGIAGTSHRRVAERADVPLGSMTYHFDGMAGLLAEAFTRFIDEQAERFARRLDGADSPDAAIRAIVDSIDAHWRGERRELVLTHELYTLAARDPAFRALTDGWMRRSRTVLERWFDPLTARLIDAMVEGVSIHGALDTTPPDLDAAREALHRIAGQDQPPR